MEKNNAGKYLKYAVGEIVLVVIGILIALSLNNWNKSRKNEIKNNGRTITKKSEITLD